MGKIKIYILKCPMQGHVTYIGITKNTLKSRLAGHMREARDFKHWPKSVWINSLIGQGLKPIIELIEECEVKDWSDRERYWVAYYKMCGFSLTNATDGGRGCKGYKPRQYVGKNKENAIELKLLRAKRRKRKKKVAAEKTRDKMLTMYIPGIWS